MRNKLIGALVILGLVIILINGSAFAKSQTYTVVVDTKTPSQVPLKDMVKGSMAERSKATLGFDPKSYKNQPRLRMELKIKDNQEQKTIEVVKGNGFLDLNGNKFNFSVDTGKSYLDVFQLNGKALWNGLIFGEIKGKNGSEQQVTIDMTYYPDTSEGQFGVVVGAIGGEIMIPFGQPIVNQDIINLIRGQ